MPRSKRVAIAMSVVLLAGCLEVAAATPEDDLRQVERDWCFARVSGDATALGAILADSYAGVTARGVAQSKVQALAELKDATTSTDSCGVTDVNVTLDGETAVVTGLGNHTGTAKGVAYKDERYLLTDTFRLTAGKWQCVKRRLSAAPRK